MAYTVEDFKTAKELEDAVQSGQEVRCFQPEYRGPDLRTFTGNVNIEGPHAPEGRIWTAEVELHDGIVTKVVKTESLDAVGTNVKEKPAQDVHTKTAKKSAPDIHTKPVKDHPMKEETKTKTKTDDWFKS